MPTGILQTSARTLTFTNSVRQWLSYCDRFTPRTRKHYRMVIWQFDSYAPKYAKDLKLEHIERYLASVKHTNRTKNAHLTALKSYCSWLSSRYGLPNACLKIKMLPEDPPNPRILDEEEYEKILEVCKPEEKLVIQWLGLTGLRESEVRSLTWNNVDQSLQFIKLTGKGRKLRVVPLCQTLQGILKKYQRQPNSPIQLLKSYMKRGNLWRLCKRVSIRAGIPMAGPHSYRHFFATELYKKGVPLHKISKILGHADTRTTEIIYCHIFPPTDLLGTTDVLDGIA